MLQLFSKTTKEKNKKEKNSEVSSLNTSILFYSGPCVFRHYFLTARVAVAPILTQNKQNTEITQLLKTPPNTKNPDDNPYGGPNICKKRPPPKKFICHNETLGPLLEPYGLSNRNIFIFD